MVTDRAGVQDPYSSFTHSLNSCPEDDIFYAISVLTILFDCVIFLLPIPLLSRIQTISRRRKMGLIGVFVLGLFTTICSVQRMLQIKSVTRNGDATGLVIWGTVEINVGVSLNFPHHVRLIPGSDQRLIRVID